MKKFWKQFEEILKELNIPKCYENQGTAYLRNMLDDTVEILNNIHIPSITVEDVKSHLMMTDEEELEKFFYNFKKAKHEQRVTMVENFINELDDEVLASLILNDINKWLKEETEKQDYLEENFHKKDEE